MTDKEQIEAFIAQRGVTKCPPAAANATPLRRMRAEHETSLMDLDACEALSSEQAAEQSRERYHRARAAGYSVSDALDESRG